MPIFDRDTSKGLFHTFIQLAGFSFITQLNSDIDLRNHEITIDKNVYSFQSIPLVDPDILKNELYKREVISKLRDLVDEFSIFLFRIYQNIEMEMGIVAFSSLLPSKKFERLGISDQLKVLEAQFAVFPEWRERLEGYNHLRNCLSHRGGIVGDQDLADGKSLIVKWISASVSFEQDEVPTSAMATVIQFELQSGSAKAKPALHDKVKKFPQGHMVVVEPRELLEILQTMHIAAAAFAGLRLVTPTS